jgi:hypothetical protein
MTFKSDEHQRGAAWDIIDQALMTYDAWMLDDDYDATSVLHQIMGQMKTALLAQDALSCSCTDHCKSEFTQVLYPKCIPSARPDFEPRSPYD